MRAFRFKQWLAPLAAALAGGGVMLFLFPRVHPAAGWGYRYDRSGFIAKARELAQAQHVDTTGWKQYVTAERRDRLEAYGADHPQDALACSITPQVVRVVFIRPGKPRAFAADLYPNGAVSGWELKEDPRDPEARYGPMTDAKGAALAVFPQIAGGQASSYKLSTEGAGTKRGSRFTWERVEWSPGFHPTIDIVVHRGQVVQAGTQLKFEDQATQKYESERQAADWLELGYFVLLFVMVVSSAVFYVFGSIQRLIPHRFALAFSGANLVFAMLAITLGSGPDGARIKDALENQQAVLAFANFGFGVLGTGLLALVVAGAGWFIAGTLRHKWWSLRLLFSRKAGSRAVGRSLTAGVLWGPPLAAIPVVTALLFPHALWTHRSAGELVSRYPVLQALDQPLHPLVLSCFGILFIFVLTRAPSAWMRYAIVAAGGLLFFSAYEQQFRNEPRAMLLEAGLMLAAMFQIFRGFDLLAVIVAETAKGIVHMAAILLLQPSPDLHGSAWRLLAILGAILSAGAILLWKAPEVEDAEEASTRSITGDIRREREQLKSEFTVAQRAQRQMLPDNPPSIPGFSFSGHCTPAKEVGGDLYDYLPLARGRLGIAVADVSGKGVPAALYMTLTKGLLAATTQDDLQLPAILEQINGHLHTVGRRKTFVTMALAILDPGSRTMEYARAGHNPAVWRSPASGSTRLLCSGGIGLGITAGKAFGRTLKVETLALSQGDTLVFYSDGLTEAMNPALEQFGEERLMEVVEGADHLSADGVRDRILEEVTRFLSGNHPQDDLTLVVLRVD